ncbi:MAG: ferredoxin family protein [Chthoniobacteraceae bacterium]
MSLTNPALRIILYEGSGADALEDESRYSIMSALLERGYTVTRSSGERAVAQGDQSPMLVLGHFRESGAPDWSDAEGKVRVQTRNISGRESAAVMDLVESFREEAGAARHGEWKPWFPVIDYDRCTNCMQCLSFCLFGVYGVDRDSQIQVQNNDNCKTNCPACSRVCPEAAIMFPKYKAGPINGDVVSASDLNREKMKIDISALLGGDVYDMLRQRSVKAKSRFSKERDSDKALAERQKCLVKLAGAGDIPPEVLASLPSPEEIERRAAEAKAKAEAALAGQGKR